MTRRPQDSFSYPPRWMRAERAAAYMDMSRSKFLELVDKRTLPGPKALDGVRVWDRIALDDAVYELSERAERPNTFDVIIGKR